MNNIHIEFKTQLDQKTLLTNTIVKLKYLNKNLVKEHLFERDGKKYAITGMTYIKSAIATPVRILIAKTLYIARDHITLPTLDTGYKEENMKALVLTRTKLEATERTLNAIATLICWLKTAEKNNVIKGGIYTKIDEDKYGKIDKALLWC